MLKICGKRSEMYLQIENNPNSEQIRIMTKPSKSVFFHILQKTNVKKIIMSEGISKTVSQKMKNALETSGVEICIISKKAGRPTKYDKDLKEQSIKLLNSGMSASKISKMLLVPQTCIYAWRRRSDNNFTKNIDST